MIDLVLMIKAIVYSISISLGAAGVTVIYNATKTFNFAHASMISWGAYIVFTFLTFYSGVPHIYFPTAFLFSGMLGVATYLLINRRLIIARASDVNLMMSTLGVDLVLFAFLNIFADYLITVHKISVAKNFVLELKDLNINLLGINVKLTWIAAPLLLVSMLLILHILFTRTRMGIAMRAAIENLELAQLQGVNPDTIYLLAWFIGGGLAGLAGSILAMIFTGRPSIGMENIVTFFAGAIVGGLNTVYGSLLGGFLIGLSEYLTPYLLAPIIGNWIYSFRAVIPLIIMVITLLFQPSGLGTLFEKRLRK